MAKKPETKFVAPVIKPGTPEAEAFLGVGYGGMTVEQANEIVKGRKENPSLYSYEKYELAKAFLAAYNAKDPKPNSTDPGWKRDRRTED